MRNMVNRKKYCNVHHFNYSGYKCPFCENDRISSLSHRYVKVVEVVKPKVENNREITQNDIERLKEKFNRVF
ncbi:MAG: hypothetical protein K2M17_04785 [Bacilli bacterium]|nr:hypothetical protein [Bacilli bacterium]